MPRRGRRTSVLRLLLVLAVALGLRAGMAMAVLDSSQAAASQHRAESHTTGLSAQAVLPYSGPRKSRPNALPDPTTQSRERMAAALGSSPQECAANAHMLFNSTPCEKRKKTGKAYGKKKKGIKPECVYAAEKLKICTCAKAAEDLISKPCSKKLDAPECAAAVAALHTCEATGPLPGR